MIRELRYLVFKIKDVFAYLTPEEVEILLSLSNKISRARCDDGKESIGHLVVESDWPEFEETWAKIAARVDGVPLYKAKIDQDAKYGGRGEGND